MTLATRVRERFRSRLVKLVEKKRAEYGCAKTAIKDVARKIGMSTVNVYRTMNGYGSATVKAHHHVALIMVSFGASAAAKFSETRKSHRAGLNA